MKFPVIEKQKIFDHGVRLDFQVTPQIQWFNGHFPKHPVLPGVVQIDWAIHFARQYFALPDGFKRMEKLKFQRLIKPGQRLSLVLKQTPNSKRFTFCYEQGENIFSSGRLDLGELIDELT